MIVELVRLGPPSAEYLDVLEESLRGADGYVRRAAVHALGYLKPQPARFVPLLIQACDDSEPLHDGSVNAAAVAALGAYGRAAENGLPRLKRFLEGPMVERSVRAADVRAAIKVIAGDVSGAAFAPAMRNAPSSNDEPLVPVRHQDRQCYIDRTGAIDRAGKFIWGPTDQDSVSCTLKPAWV